MATIEIQCPACQGRGLYSGFAEPKGTAVICLGCKGQGWAAYTYEPFEGRRPARGIKEIRESQGRSLVVGVGGIGKPMTYAQFEAAYPVKRTLVASHKQADTKQVDPASEASPSPKAGARRRAKM
jgi:hypothetical protein